MIIIDAIPRDIHVVADFELTNLVKLETILDNMTFNYDSTVPEHVEAKKYLEQVLYPTVKEAIRKYSNDS